MTRALPRSEELFAQHADYVYRVVRYLGARDADVEDLVQEVFMVVLRARERFRGESSAESWLFGIARNVCRDHDKRAYRRREEPTDRLDADPGASDDPEQLAHFRQTLARLDRVLAGLNDEQRMVFLLHDVEQLTMREITEGMRCPLQTGYTRLRAARKHVRETMEQRSVELA